MRLSVLLLVSACLLSAAEQIVFRGTPAVRLFATADTEERIQLDSESAARNTCIIVQRGKKFFWASRNNIPVLRVDTAQFTYFLHTESGAYVKVFTGTRGTLKSSADYLEHINRGLDTITYWGRAQSGGQ